MDILLRTIVDTDHHSPAVSDHLGPVQLLHLLHLLQPCQGELRAPLRLGHVPAARPEISGMYLFISQMLWFLCHTVAWVAYCVFTIVQDEEDAVFSV